MESRMLGSLAQLLASCRWEVWDNILRCLAVGATRSWTIMVVSSFAQCRACARRLTLAVTPPATPGSHVVGSWQQQRNEFWWGGPHRAGWCMRGVP